MVRARIAREEIDPTHAVRFFGMEQLDEGSDLPSLEIRTALQLVIGVWNDAPACKQADLSILKLLEGE